VKPGTCLTLAALLWLLPSAADAGTVRYLREQNLIVVEYGGAMTLTALKAALPTAPLQLVDRERRVWLLSASLLLTGGSTLRLHGRKAGGDVDELRLKSDNTPAPGAIVSLTADHGTLDIRSTRITSWDTASGGPDVEYETYGRAFIRARSRMRSMTLIPLQSRMDVIDSEVAFLGYSANESYGLVWKVVAPDPFVFDYVRVHGNVIGSRIHDNYFGLYASGARGSEWRGNHVHHNVQYGLAPHTRSDDLRIEDNDVHDNGRHGITVRQHCARVQIRNNRVWGNGESGITLHRRSNSGLIEGNRVFRNGEAGILVSDSAGVTVRGNLVRENAHIGIQLAMGASDNRIEANSVRGNGFYGLFVGKGRGQAPPGGDGHPRRNHIAANRVWGSTAENLRMGNAALNVWVGNTEVPEQLATVNDSGAPAAPVP
jgi:parallel beta-helix repeat protein